MEVQYLREMRQNYLMIDVEEGREQGYEARMMIGNTIEGLLKFRIKKSDNKCKFCYEITSKQPLSRILEKQTIDAEQLQKLILGISRTLTKMEDYLLTEEQILLDPDYIYVDAEEYQPFLCLLPGKKGDFTKEFSLFLQFLLEKVNHEDKEAVVLIYGLYRESLKENYGLDNLLKWLMRENYPNVEYSGKGEKCETINTEKIESWEKEEPKEETETLWAQRTTSPGKFQWYFYFLPGAGMFFLAGGIRFFSGRQELIRYGVWLAAAGIVLLALGGIVCGYRFFSKKDMYQIIPPFPIFGGSVSHNHIPHKETIKSTSSNNSLFHDLTSFRETSVETSEHNSLISNQNSQQQTTSVQLRQWQMVFEEPEEEKSNEISAPTNFGQEEMHTVLLWNQNEEKQTRSLVSRDGERVIPLSYYPFIIGKQEGLCDYVIDRSTISRLHVRFDETQEGYQITDLNSTNGTFINGKSLEANETASVQPGDEIGIADLRFQLK